MTGLLSFDNSMSRDGSIAGNSAKKLIARSIVQTSFGNWSPLGNLMAQPTANATDTRSPPNQHAV
jgi:hypothetical protein